jgi:hypothetical protein
MIFPRPRPPPSGMSAPDQSQLVVRGPPARNDDRGNHHAVHGMATALSGGLRRRSPKSRVAAAMDSRAARQSKAHVQRQSADASHGGTCFARRYASQAQSRRRRWPERPGFTGAALSETIGLRCNLDLIRHFVLGHLDCRASRTFDCRAIRRVILAGYSDRRLGFRVAESPAFCPRRSPARKCRGRYRPGDR